MAEHIVYALTVQHIACAIHTTMLCVIYIHIWYSNTRSGTNIEMLRTFGTDLLGGARALRSDEDITGTGEEV